MADADPLILDLLKIRLDKGLTQQDIADAMGVQRKHVTDMENGKARPEPYDAGSSGPDEALGLMHRDKRRWREIRA